MKRFSPTLLGLIAALSLVTAALAQNPPTGGPPGDGPPGAGQDDRPRPGQRGDGQRGDGQGPMGQGPMGPRQGGVPPEVARFQNYLTMVDSYAKLAKDPDAAAVAAVVSAADVLRPKGAQGAIDYFTKILPEVKSPTVQRAIRLQLMDFYKAANQPEKALEQLQAIMTMADKKE
jgi:hypothetical protein